MNFQELVELFAFDGDYTKKAVREVLQYAFDRIGDAAMVDGERVNIPGFGVFRRRTRKSRYVRNPKTNEPMKLPAMQALGFRPSKFQRGPK